MKNMRHILCCSIISRKSLTDERCILRKIFYFWLGNRAKNATRKHLSLWILTKNGRNGLFSSIDRFFIGGVSLDRRAFAQEGGEISVFERDVGFKAIRWVGLHERKHGKKLPEHSLYIPSQASRQVMPCSRVLKRPRNALQKLHATQIPVPNSKIYFYCFYEPILKVQLRFF